MFTNYYQELGISSKTATKVIINIINNEIAKINIKKENLKENLGFIRNLTLSLNEMDYKIERLKEILFHLGNDIEREKYDRELEDLEKILPLDIFKKKNEQQFTHNLNKSFFVIINDLINKHNHGKIVRNTKDFDKIVKEFYRLKRRVEWVHVNCDNLSSKDAEWLLEMISKTKFIEIIIEGKILEQIVQLSNHQILPEINSLIPQFNDSMNEYLEQDQLQLEFTEKAEQITNKINELASNNNIIFKEIENLQKQKRNPIINFLFSIFSFGCYNKNKKINEKINLKNNEIEDNLKNILKFDKQKKELELLYKNKKIMLPDIVPSVNHANNSPHQQTINNNNIEKQSLLDRPLNISKEDWESAGPSGYKPISPQM